MGLGRYNLISQCMWKGKYQMKVSFIFVRGKDRRETGKNGGDRNREIEEVWNIRACEILEHTLMCKAQIHKVSLLLVHVYTLYVNSKIDLMLNLVHGWWGCKLVQPFMENDMELSSKKKKRKHHVKSVTQWTAARQIPLSMEFPRQQYWSGKPFPSPADLPDPGVEPVSPTLQVDSLLSKPPRKPHMIH